MVLTADPSTATSGFAYSIALISLPRYKRTPKNAGASVLLGAPAWFQLLVRLVRRIRRKLNSVESSLDHLHLRALNSIDSRSEHFNYWLVIFHCFVTSFLFGVHLHS